MHPVADAGLVAWVLAVTPDLAARQLGAPARLLRAQRLALYRSTPDWSLGWAELLPAGGWAGIQPVAGPLEPARRGGLHLEWLDSTAAPTAGIPAVVAITVRAPSRRGLRSRGGAAPVDSQRRLLVFRNDK